MKKRGNTLFSHEFNLQNEHSNKDIDNNLLNSLFFYLYYTK